MVVVVAVVVSFVSYIFFDPSDERTWQVAGLTRCNNDTITNVSHNKEASPRYRSSIYLSDHIIMMIVI